jgi:hypothetical protein
MKSEHFDTPLASLYLESTFFFANDCGSARRATNTHEMHGPDVCNSNSIQTNKSVWNPLKLGLFTHMMQPPSPSRLRVASTPQTLTMSFDQITEVAPSTPSFRVIFETLRAGSAFCIHSSADDVHASYDRQGCAKLTGSPRRQALAETTAVDNRNR